MLENRISRGKIYVSMPSKCTSSFMRAKGGKSTLRTYDRLACNNACALRHTCKLAPSEGKIRPLPEVMASGLTIKY